MTWLLEQENTIKDKDEQIKTLIGKINLLEEKVEQISKITKQHNKVNKANTNKKIVRLFFINICQLLYFTG